MTTRVRAIIVLGCCMLILVVGGALAFYVVHGFGGGTLMALVKEGGPLSEAQRQQEVIDVVGLAEENAQFRQWLVGVVTSDQMDMDVRRAALERLLELRSDKAVRDIAHAFLPWLAEPADSRPEFLLHSPVGNGIYYSLLQTDLPMEEVLELADGLRPRWRFPVEDQAGRQKGPEAPPPSEYERKRDARQQELLEFARSKDEATLMARVKAEAPLPEGREVALPDLPGLAEGDGAFRKWLAGIVASPQEDHWVRALAFKALLDVQSDEAIRALMDDLHAWFRNRDAELDREGRDYQRQVSDLMLDRLLLTDLPVEDVLKLAKQSFPFWDTHAVAVAVGDPREGAPWSEEQEARLEDRAMALIEAKGGELLEQTRRRIASHERFGKARE